MLCKYIEVKELTQSIELDHNGLEQEMVLLQAADDNVFSVLSSFITQEAGKLIHPYLGIECVFSDEVGSFYTNEVEEVTVFDVLQFPETLTPIVT